MKKFIKAVCITIMVSLLACVVHANSGYTDVSPETPYYEAIMKMSSEGLVHGDEAGAFHPNQNVSAPEFMYMLQGAFGDGSLLPDVAELSAFPWHSLQWVPVHVFMGRYDTAICGDVAAQLLLLAKGENILKQAVYGIDSELPKNVSDAIYSCKQYGYIEGYGDDYLLSSNLVSRAEACELVYKAAYNDTTRDMPDVEPTGLITQMVGFGENEAAARTMVEESLWQLPEYVREAFKRDGWKLIVATGDHYIDSWNHYIDSHIPYQHSLGVYYRHRKVIIVGSPEPSTIWHEFGHFVANLDEDYPTWETLYKADAGAVMDITMHDYAGADVDQFFAEAYEVYIETPTMLESLAPKTYAYIHSLSE